MSTSNLIAEAARPSTEKDGFLFVPARLFLANGMTLEGTSPSWQQGTFDGEVVFTTDMTGYEASLTDPSSAGQILVFKRNVCAHAN